MNNEKIRPLIFLKVFKAERVPGEKGGKYCGKSK
jgi:hypothetical protein